MNGKEAIIASIIGGAEQTAAGILSDARAEKDKLLEDTRNNLMRERDAQLDKAARDAEELKKRRLTLAELDSRKVILAAKQRVIDSVYYEAVTKILNMTDNVYREFMGGFVEKYAENGDTVVTSERDAKRLNETWVEGLAKKLNLRLTLADYYHHGRGGIVLEGRYCDKNLTLETLVKEIRPETEARVAKRLFDNDKNN